MSTPESSTPKPQASADELASLLEVELVNGPIIVTLPDEAAGVVDEATYTARVHLYRRAAILLALGVAERQRPEFRAVLRAFERHVFPPAATPDGVRVLERIKLAMEDLNTLVGGDAPNRELSWSRGWYAGMNASVTNPAVLTLNAVSWMRFWVTTHQCLADVDVRR
jgi:hypothetical protein